MSIVKEGKDTVSTEEKLNLLQQVVDILNIHDIDYWLEFGTLLGYVRDKQFIPWDADIDIATYEMGKIENLKEKFEEKNLIIAKKYFETSYKSTIVKIFDKESERTKSHIDIYEFEKTKQGSIFRTTTKKNIIAKLCYLMYLGLETYKIPFTENLSRRLGVMQVFFSEKRIYFYNNVKTKKVKFYDITVKVPTDLEEHCLLMYGKSWKTPIKGDVAVNDFCEHKGKGVLVYKLFQGRK